jgi:integrase/recombinase XerD
MDIISESPLTTIYYEKSPPPLKSRNILTTEEIEELLKAIKAFSPGYLYPLIKMFAETAGKTSEVTDLLWNDVNLEKGEVHFVQTTASQERTVKISDELVEILKKKKSTKGHVFLTYYGETFTKNKIRRAILEFKAKGTFEKDWGPMDLRHSFAVNFLKRGGTLRELQGILGHDNVYQTKQLYGETIS